MHMGRFIFVSCISFQIRRSHKAQVLNRLQLPQPRNDSDKSHTGLNNTRYKLTQCPISYFKLFINVTTLILIELQILEMYLLFIWLFSYRTLISDVFTTTNWDHGRFFCRLTSPKSQRSFKQRTSGISTCRFG